MAELFRVRCSITGTAVGGGLSTFYFDKTTGLTAAAASSAVNAFWTALVAWISSATTIIGDTEVARIDPATGDLLGMDSVTGFTVTATDGGETMPLFTQGLLRLRTGVASDGREIRGRLFIPGVTESRNQFASPMANYRTAVDSAAATLVASASAHWHVWRRPRPYRPAVPPGPGYPRGLRELPERVGESASVSSASTWENWASLRSRRD